MNFCFSFLSTQESQWEEMRCQDTNPFMKGSSKTLVQCTLSIKTLNYHPSTTLKGDIETVTVRLSVGNESPLTATIFHRSLPNLYNMFIPMKNFMICSFMKNGQNCCHGLKTYLPMVVL